MSFNGSGSFQINSAGQPVIDDTTIDATVHNTFTADIAGGLTNCICKDGQTTVTANLPMNSKKFTGLADGSSRADSASIGNIVDGTGVYVVTVGGTANAITLAPSPPTTAYVAGQTFRFIAAASNTGAATVAVSGLAAKSITKLGATALAAADILIGMMISITYDGTRFILAAPPADVTRTGTQTLTNKTLTYPIITSPIITGGALSDPIISSPIITGGALSIPTLTDPIISSPTITGGTLSITTLTDPIISSPILTGTVNMSGGTNVFPGGPWLPSLGGTTTYTSRGGTYVKAGKAVTFHGFLIVNLIGTGSVYVVSGLPFPVDAIDGAVSIVDSGSLATAVVSMSGKTNGSSILIYSRTAASTSDTIIAVFGNGTYIHFGGSYIATT